MNLTSIVYIIYYSYDSVHSGGLPVLASGIVHTDYSYFISYFHDLICC